MGFLTGRLIMWAVIGGGGLAVLASLYTGGLLRGKNAERAEWNKSVVVRTKQVREVNNDINQETLDSDARLMKREQELRERWAPTLDIKLTGAEKDD